MRQVDGATAVISLEDKVLNLFDSGKFRFRQSDVVVDVEDLIESPEKFKIIGEITPMVQVINFDDDEAHTRKQYQALGIQKEFESFDTGVVKKTRLSLKWPFYKTTEEEVCYIPDGNYGAKKSARYPVEVSLFKSEYTIFDHRKDTDDK